MKLRPLLFVILPLACVLLALRPTHEVTPDSIEHRVSESKQTIEGRVINIDARELSVRYTIDATTADGKVLLISRVLWPRYQYGDLVSATGRLEKPEAFDGFAYDDYLSVADVYVLMRPDTMMLVKEHEFSILGVLFSLRQRVSGLIGSLFPEPHASLIDGLLTGNRSSVPEDVLNDFKITGLTHLLAISGYNIAIVIAMISSFLFFLPQRWRLAPSILAVVAFTIFTGASASVIRAAIMGILGLIALHTGRLNDARLAVLWTALFMIAWNPNQLWFDPSFQLSFLSVIGLIECQPILSRWLARVPETGGLRDGLALTLSAQLFAAPWGILLFAQLPLISPLSNLLVPPFVPIAMGAGALALLFGSIWLPLGQVFAFIAWLCSQLILTITHLLSLVPYASVNVPGVQAWVIGGYYVALAFVLFKLRSSSSDTQTPSPAGARS